MTCVVMMPASAITGMLAMPQVDTPPCCWMAMISGRLVVPYIAAAATTTSTNGMS